RALPTGALDPAGPPEMDDVPAELRDAALDVLPIHLQLRLARPSGPDPAAQPGHGLAPAAEPREQVVQLRQLDLRLALAGAGVQGEDVQDQRGPVEDLRPEPLLQAPELPWGQLVVEDDRLRPGGVDQLVD